MCTYSSSFCIMWLFTCLTIFAYSERSYEAAENFRKKEKADNEKRIKEINKDSEEAQKKLIAKLNQKDMEFRDYKDKTERQQIVVFYIQEKLADGLRDIIIHDTIRNEGLAKVFGEACRLSRYCASLQNSDLPKTCKSSQNFCASLQKLKGLRSAIDEFDAETINFKNFFWVFLVEHPDLVNLIEEIPAIGGGLGNELFALPANY
jgi:hypothetical protein